MCKHPPSQTGYNSVGPAVSFFKLPAHAIHSNKHFFCSKFLANLPLDLFFAFMVFCSETSLVLPHSNIRNAKYLYDSIFNKYKFRVMWVISKVMHGNTAIIFSYEAECKVTHICFWTHWKWEYHSTGSHIEIYTNCSNIKKGATKNRKVILYDVWWRHWQWPKHHLFKLIKFYNYSRK